MMNMHMIKLYIYNVGALLGLIYGLIEKVIFNLKLSCKQQRTLSCK